MRKTNKILAIAILILSMLGIMISMGVIYSYASMNNMKELNSVNNTSKNNVYVDKNESIENSNQTSTKNENSKVNNNGNTIKFTEKRGTVYATSNVNIRTEPNADSEIVGVLAQGNSIVRTATGSNGWDKVIFNNTTRYISHNYLSTEKPKELVKENNIVGKEYSEEWVKEFNNKVAELQQKYPKGYYWNHAGNGKNLGVTTVPCDHKNGKCYCNVYDSKSTKACGFKVGRQCAGFASLLSDEIFGKDAPVRIFYNYDEIRVGDQARINNNSHTVFIIEKTDDYVVVAECNADYKTCVINWGRKIPRNQLKGYYITRWQ